MNNVEFEWINSREFQTKLTAARKFVDIFRAGSVTAGIEADKHNNMDLGFSIGCAGICAEGFRVEGGGITVVVHFGNDKRSI